MRLIMKRSALTAIYATAWMSRAPSTARVSGLTLVDITHPARVTARRVASRLSLKCFLSFAMRET